MAVVFSCAVMVRVFGKGFGAALGGGASFGHAVLGGSTFDGGGGGGADMRRGRRGGGSVGEQVCSQMRCDTEDGVRNNTTNDGRRRAVVM